MKILFVSAVLPYPLYSGGQIRIYNLLKILSNKHEITLYSFIRDKSELEFIKNLPFCRKVETVLRGHAWQPKYVVSSVLGKYPLLLSTYDIREMQNKLSLQIKADRYDLLHIEPGYVWPAIAEAQLPTVASEHNIESAIYEDYVRHFPVPAIRPLLYLDVLKLKYWERKIWRKAKGIVTVSESDEAVIARHINGQKIAVVPNGVDQKVFTFKPKSKIGQPPVFLFVGNFSWLENRDALGFLLRNLWPSIKKSWPGAILRVIGKQMPEGLKNLAEKNEAAVLEDVPHIRAEYQKADIMLAPIRIGGGTKFKILEAMAVGLPVIATSKAIEGLNVTNGEEIVIAHGPEEINKSIRLITNDNKYRKKIIQNARRKIEEEYSWETISPKLDDLWHQVYEKR